jgi:RimJ/RimL family protein N-acetyltransferase
VYFGIFLKEPDGSEGELIGDGGVHKFVSDEIGWPEFGYKLKKEHWGYGYATEFVKVFMEFWWNLTREPRSLLVRIPAPGLLYTPKVRERVYAWTTRDNRASQRVLMKVGFEKIEGINNGLINWQFISPLIVGRRTSLL